MARGHQRSAYLEIHNTIVEIHEFVVENLLRLFQGRGDRGGFHMNEFDRIRAFR